MWSLGWFLRALIARLHGGCGWCAYRLGLRGAARRHYERVLSLRGADFTAYVHLGRIAFDIGDYAGWRRELEHARRLDPERFARLRHPLELFEPRLAGTMFDALDDETADFDATQARATWRTLRPGQSQPRALSDGLDGTDGPGGAGQGRVSKHLPGTGASADDDARRDDCQSATERERLRELGPIRRADVQRCDLDELLRKLSG